MMIYKHSDADFGKVINIDDEDEKEKAESLTEKAKDAGKNDDLVKEGSKSNKPFWVNK
jgi:hypothetical protein